MRKFLALLFALLLCVATKVYAEDAATVTVTVKYMPQKLQNRTVIVTLGNGPSDTESTVIVLDGLNNYTETVTVVPSEYYCAAAVQYDALGDYPLQEINQTTFLQAEGGNHYDLIYNQIAKRCNENKSVHANDVEQLRREFLELKADYLERVVKLLRKIY